jgi:hypothetical protein
MSESAVLEIFAPQPASVGGRWLRLEAHILNEAGEIVSTRILSDGFDEPVAFPNLITNQGLDFMGNSTTYLTACQVGQGVTAPAFTDTQLASYLAGTATRTSAVSSAQVAVSPFYVEHVIVYRFAAGVAAGNLTEIGVSTTAATGNLYSRALILDAGGLPTTVVVLAGEVLDATYAHRTYAPAADAAGNVTISAVNYSWVCRPCNVNSVNTSGGLGGAWGCVAPGTSGSIMYADLNGSSHTQRAYTGPLVAQNAGNPTGTSFFDLSNTPIAYVPGSLQVEGVQTYDLTRGNVPGGIGVVKFSFGWCAWQISFSPVIPKNATNNLTLRFRHSWTRH